MSSLQNQDNLNTKALKAGTVYIVTQFVVRGLTFLVTPLYTRLLSQAQYGQIRIYESWLLILVPLMALGLYRGIERFRYDDPEHFDAYTSSSQTLAYLSITAFFLVFLVFSRRLMPFFGMDPFMFGLMYFYVLAFTATLIFQQHEKQLMSYRRMTLLTVLTMVPAVLLSVLLIYWGKRNGCDGELVSLRLAGYYIPQILGGIVAAVLIFKEGRTTVHKGYWKYGLAYSLPLVPNQLSMQIMNQSDKIMVQKMIGDDEAGIFVLATTISFIMWILLDAVWEAFLPWLYEKVTREEREDVARPWFGLCALLTVISVLIVLAAPELIAFLGGASYREARFLTAPMLLGVLFRFFSQVYSAMGNYVKRTRPVAAGTVCCMALNVILNYVCILKWGYMAAAYTTAFSYLVLMVVQALIEKRVSGRRLVSLPWMLGLSVLSAGVMTGAMALFRLHWAVRWAVVVIVGLAVLAAGLCAFRKLKKA